MRKTYPGVYVEEVPSGVRTIRGVSTSDTAFVDSFKRGPMDKAVRITSWADFERTFGGLDANSAASYQIQQFYLNGGSISWVCRVAAPDAAAANVHLPAHASYVSDASGLSGGPGMALEVAASSQGKWGNKLQVGIDYKGTAQHSPSNEPIEFNMVIREFQEVGGKRRVVAHEIHRNLSLNLGSTRYVENVVNTTSQLVRVKDVRSGFLPDATHLDAEAEVDDGDDPDFLTLGEGAGNTIGSDGVPPGSSEWIASSGADAILGRDHAGTAAINAGLSMLDRIAPFVFNILCLPAAVELDDSSYETVVSEATKYCRQKRAFFIVDIPESVQTPAAMTTWMKSKDTLRDDHAAIYFPRVKIADALDESRLKDIPTSGTLAGIYARTDSTRGIWQAPAGTDASLKGAVLCSLITDFENGGLNQIGINVLRRFPVFGAVLWGGRTMDGADEKASEWKYIPVRRTALYIEESLFQGLKWVVFEPNDEPLWSQIRLNVGAFMHGLFRQGAFQGTSPREAYFVKCDGETTTQNDIDRGVVNIVVGFAPLKPAEFVIIKTQQIAQQVQS
jgi:phage tail sheath protein FI